MPDNVHMFLTKKPETLRLDTIDVAIHGQGFPTKAVTADLSAQYPPAVQGMFNIGMLHTSLTGRDGHANYAPCKIDGLKQKGYDYWALGHVHTREKVDSDVAIWFPGNIQGRHIRETGPKGCLLVTVADDNDVEVAFQELDVVRWMELDIDVSEAESYGDCIKAFQNRLKEALDDSKGRFLAIRVKIEGESKSHDAITAAPKTFINDIRAAANDYGNDMVWIEKVLVSTYPAVSHDTPFPDEGPLGELVNVIDSCQTDEDALRELIDELSPLMNKLPRELVEGEDSLHLDEPETVRKLIEQARPMLFARLRRSERES